MVPSAFRVLSELPLTPNGKVDRAALAPTSAPLPSEPGEAGPPRDALERELAGLWESMLGVPVDRAARFFDLGGHSLLAVRLLARIGKRFGRDLPLATLFAAPTVAGLANILRTGGGVPSGPLVPIQPEGTEPPFFCVHPAGGSVLAYRELARHLGRPFYGIQSLPPTDGGGGIPALADLYIKDVLRLQPDGPYHLGGWSMGALVAFEMACRLEQQGRDVALLALLDPTPLGALSTLSTEEGDLLAGFVRDLTGLGQIATPDLDLEAWRPHFETYRANLLALRDYRPGVFHGRAHLFLAREGKGEDWSAHLVDGAEIHPVPGGHYGLLREPDAREWGGRLREALDPAAKAKIPE
jgi:thioesterase domain-containing protein/acyl carrier protein